MLFDLICLCFIFMGILLLIVGNINIRKNKNLLKNDKVTNANFAVLIPARDESLVIEGLLKSLKAQTIKFSMQDVYVIVETKEDKTVEICQKYDATVIIRTTKRPRKGYALDEALKQIKKEYDLYFIFDADNVVHPEFLSRMNDALCDGHKVAQGFRDSKNPSDNWISGSYSIFYWIQNFFFSKARMQMGGSSSINGTGFMVKKEIIDEYGFNTVTLTEDVEFTAQCALNGIKIVFVEDAITYDEQPTEFKASWKQRKRWSMGNIQCFRYYSRRLSRTYLKTSFLPCLDMLLSFMAPYMQILTTLLTVVLILFRILNVELYDIFAYMYSYGILFFIVAYLANVIVNIFVVIYNKKNVREVMSGILLFTLFMLTWIPINFICLFKKDLTWEPIKHKRSVGIEEIKK